MDINLKFKCIKVPTIGSFDIYSVYEGYEGWYDADAGETEMRIWDNNCKCCRFRDYDWLQYFKEF